MDNTAADYSDERKGLVFLDVDLEAIKAWWIKQGLPPAMAEEGAMFTPNLFNDYARLLDLTIYERHFIWTVWGYWSHQTRKQPCFRVWGRQPPLDELVQSIHRSARTIKGYTKSLQQKGLLIVSGDIYDFTPLLEALVEKAPLSRDRVDMERILQKVRGK